MDRGAWGAAVYGVAKSRTRVSDFTSLHFFFIIILVLYYCLSTKKIPKDFCLQQTHTHICLSHTHTQTHTHTHTDTHTHTLCCWVFLSLQTYFSQWSSGSITFEWVLHAYTRNSFWKGPLILFFHLWHTQSRYTLKNEPMNFCVAKAIRKLASSKVCLGSQARLRNQGRNLTSCCYLPLALYILNGRTRAWK